MTSTVARLGLWTLASNCLTVTIPIPRPSKVRRTAFVETGYCHRFFFFFAIRRRSRPSPLHR